MLPFTEMVCRFEQPSTKYALHSFTLAGKLIEVNALQFLKAYDPILSKLEFKATEDKAVQPLNADLPTLLNFE